MGREIIGNIDALQRVVVHVEIEVRQRQPESTKTDVKIDLHAVISMNIPLPPISL